MAGFEDQLDGVLHVAVRADGVDIDAGRHDFMDGRVVELEGAGDDAPLIFFNIIDIVRLLAFLLLVDETEDFVFGGVHVLCFALGLA